MSPTTLARPAPAFEYALLGLLAAVWGASYLLIRVALATIPPVTLIAIRVSVAAAFLLAVMWHQRARFPADRRTWRLLLVQSLYNSILPWTLLAWGQQHVPSGLAGVLNSTSPLFVFFLTLLVTRHEAVGAWKFAGAVAGVAGVALIVGLDALHGLGEQLGGQAAILLGALLYAGAAIHGKRFARLSPTVTAAGTMVWAVACLIPLCLVVDRPWTLSPSAASLAAALALGLVCTGAALLLYFRLLRTLGSMGVASQSYLRAGVSVLLGVFVLGETITPAIAFGLAAIVAGVAMILAPVSPAAPR